MKKYTQVRQFYAWVGFVFLVLCFSVGLASLVRYATNKVIMGTIERHTNEIRLPEDVITHK